MKKQRTQGNKKNSKSNQSNLSESYKNFVIAIGKVQELLIPFIRRIVSDSYDNPDDIYYKVGIEANFYKIGLFNKKTGLTAIKHYDIQEFLQLASNAKKYEFEINMVIKSLLADTLKKSNDKIILT